MSTVATVATVATQSDYRCANAIYPCSAKRACSSTGAWRSGIATVAAIATARASAAAIARDSCTATVAAISLATEDTFTCPAFTARTTGGAVAAIATAATIRWALRGEGSIRTRGTRAAGTTETAYATGTAETFGKRSNSASATVAASSAAAPVVTRCT